MKISVPEDHLDLLKHPLLVRLEPTNFVAVAGGVSKTQAIAVSALLNHIAVDDI